MTANEINQLLKPGQLPDGCLEPNLIETHTAWVILGNKYAYKIKKPVKFPFLDFSTLSNRNFYCRREVLLNSRLAGDIYLEKVPVWEENGTFSLEIGQGTIVDWAVKMIKVSPYTQMDILLKENSVTVEDTEEIAKIMAQFHQESKPLQRNNSFYTQRAAFNEIQNLLPWLQQHGQTYLQEVIQQAVHVSDDFLRSHVSLLKKRMQKGMIRDCHGDLHSGNIFLTQPPIIFDCIEFNDHLRQMDVLSEIAFLCMDLEFHGHTELSDAFLTKYVELFPCLETSDEIALFIYYKLYRANVRMKVHLLKANQSTSNAIHDQEWKLAGDYAELMHQYMSVLERSKVPLKPFNLLS